MKAGFERAYQALAVYDFADAESRENALWALHWAAQARNTLVGHTFRPPLVIITGVSGTGKTRLAAKVSDNEATYGCGRKVGMILNAVAINAVPVAVVDNVMPL